MADIKLTKNELKKQKDDLKRFTRYLPTLELKKTLLVQEMNRVRDRVTEVEAQAVALQEEVSRWAAVFADEGVDLEPYCAVRQVRTDTSHIAGVDVPVYDGVEFTDVEADPEATPLWVDAGVDAVRRQRELGAEARIGREQLHILQAELQATVQRIKLFEEVRIPAARRNIRTILIFLGDQQTAAVARGKMAKRRMLRKRAQEAAA